MTEDDLRRRLEAADAPDRDAAEERAWRVVGAAYDERGPRRANGGGRRRTLIAAATAAVAIAVAASPAGATVADWVRDVFAPGHPDTEPALVELPAAGRLLATSPTGAWVVPRDGAKRRLGPYRDATWSPRGLFVAATSGRELVALEPGGEVRWALAGAARASDPAWSPDGYRIAYRSGRGLRVVAGDGTGDRRLAATVAAVRPAWRPGARHVLALAEPDGRVAVVAADSGRVLWRGTPGPRPEALAWTSDGQWLLALTGHAVRVFAGRGRELEPMRAPTGARFTAMAVHPGDHRIALAQEFPGQLRGETVVRTLGGGPARRLFSGDGSFSDLTWSPDGGWLLIGWPAADQWLFVRAATATKVRATSDVTRRLDPAATPKVVATSGVSRQLDPGDPRRAGFPTVEGWCCARSAP